jgi:hypothetical protein
MSDSEVADWDLNRSATSYLRVQNEFLSLQNRGILHTGEHHLETRYIDNTEVPKSLMATIWRNPTASLHSIGQARILGTGRNDRYYFWRYRMFEGERTPDKLKSDDQYNRLGKTKT